MRYRCGRPGHDRQERRACPGRRDTSGACAPAQAGSVPRLPLPEHSLLRQLSDPALIKQTRFGGLPPDPHHPEHSGIYTLSNYDLLLLNRGLCGFRHVQRSQVDLHITEAGKPRIQTNPGLPCLSGAHCGGTNSYIALPLSRSNTAFPRCQRRTRTAALLLSRIVPDILPFMGERSG